tara:strand:+ start:267 stop:869 length:603 start_codon:yes stop_codon:yes gene_type:complete
MRTIKTFTFTLIFILALNNLSAACDLLGINIGGDKSEIENYFGTIDDLDGMIVDPENSDEEFTEENNDANETITMEGLTVSTPIDDFCPNSNLGNAIIHAFIVEDKIAGILVEVLNGTNNEESKKRLLYNYVTSNYGSIEDSDDPNWTGSKNWNISGKEVLYTKIYLTENFLVEELQITNSKYISYLLDNEPFGEDEDDE